MECGSRPNEPVSPFIRNADVPAIPFFRVRLMQEDDEPQFLDPWTEFVEAQGGEEEAL